MTMDPQQRWRRRRRDSGLARVGAWTRAAIGAGVILSGILVAQVAHLLPGQAVASSTQPAAQPAAPAQAAPTPSTSATRATRHHHHKTSAPATTAPSTPALAPPAQAPQPATSPPSVTTGAS